MIFSKFKVKYYFLLFMLLIFSACKKTNPIVDPQIPIQKCFSGTKPGNGSLIMNEYIVIYKEHNVGKLITERSQSILSRNSIEKNSLLTTFSSQQTGFVCKLSYKQLLRLKKDPEVKFIEPDRIMSVSICLTVVNNATATWGTRRIGYGDGTGKTAWIIDTGIDINHSDLNVDTRRSRSFIVDDTSAQDRNGHGTHVAGIIGAKNNNIGTLGIASGANLVGLKVLNQIGSGKTSTVIKALGYISENAVVGDVVNMSLVSDTISQSLDNEVIALANKGILFAIAAGNSSKLVANISPVRIIHPNVFKAAAMDSTDTWAPYSNYGEQVDVAAPGEYIHSTYLNNKYAIMGGTSTAAPHLAGLLLLDGRNFNKKGTVRLAPNNVSYPIPHKR